MRFNPFKKKKPETAAAAAIENDDFRELMAAITLGMLLIAFADKKFGQSERDLIIEVMEATTGGRIPADQILANLEGLVGLISNLPEKDRPSLFVNARKFSIEWKHRILDMCLRMTFADGHADMR